MSFFNRNFGKVTWEIECDASQREAEGAGINMSDLITGAMSGFDFGKEDLIHTKKSHQTAKTYQLGAQSKFSIATGKNLKLAVDSNKDEDRDEEGIKFELPEEGNGKIE